MTGDQNHWTPFSTGSFERGEAGSADVSGLCPLPKWDPCIKLGQCAPNIVRDLMAETVNLLAAQIGAGVLQIAAHPFVKSH